MRYEIKILGSILKNGVLDFRQKRGVFGKSASLIIREKEVKAGLSKWSIRNKNHRENIYINAQTEQPKH